jgi:CelD/BcsL family acetyltransferase involved in cellulose biosynthesis
MNVELYNQATGFDSLQAGWNALLQHGVTNTLFVTWEWQRAWWSSFGQGKQLRLLAVRDDNGSLRAVIPLFMQDTLLDPNVGLPEINVERPAARAGGKLQRTVHWVGGTEVSDYLDAIVPPDDHQQACAAWVDYLDKEADWEILDLRCLPSGSPTVPTVAALAEARGWHVQQVREDVCPVLELPGTWEEYLSKLDKKQRHELRRKMRRAEERAQVDWHWVDGSDWKPGLDTFLRLHKLSDPEKEAFMDQTMEGFFRAVTRAALEKGWLRLSVLRFDGQPVASYLCFDYGQDRLVYNSGFDLSSYAESSPGIVLLGYLIEDATRQGLRRFDFLQGNERYKYDLGATDTEVLRLFIRRRAA